MVDNCSIVDIMVIIVLTCSSPESKFPYIMCSACIQSTDSILCDNLYFILYLYIILNTVLYSFTVLEWLK